MATCACAQRGGWSANVELEVCVVAGTGDDSPEGPCSLEHGIANASTSIRNVARGCNAGSSQPAGRGQPLHDNDHNEHDECYDCDNVWVLATAHFLYWGEETLW